MYSIQEQEERDFVVATDADWDRAEARELGELNPDQAWVLTDRDVWHANPFYQGPPVPHPEMEPWGDEEAEEAAPLEIAPPAPEAWDEDIPF